MSSSCAVLLCRAVSLQATGYVSDNMEIMAQEGTGDDWKTAWFD